MDVPPLDWELEEMFSSWNSAVWAIGDLIQGARNHRTTMILDKLYKAFFHCEDFLQWAYKPSLPATFLLAFEIMFERGLYLHNEGYDTDVDYDLPQPLKKTDYIYVVTSTAETSFDPMGYQRSAIPAFMSTPIGRPAEPLLLQMVHRHLNFDDSPPPAVVPDDDKEEEDFPTALLDDLVWSKECIPERELCIHMALRKPETSHPSQIPSQLQEPVYESATLEEPMDSMISDMPDFINVPKQVLFWNYLCTPWMWTHMNDARHQ